MEFHVAIDLLRCGFACEGGKKEIVKSWEKPEENEADEDDLDIGITRNASEKKKKEKDSWRLDGRGKVKRLHKNLWWRQR